ncbi:MAG: glutamate--tRNA ligase [Bacteroidales bacterium]|nr:glutamate--tRNA ligase [Bacteroidales bacterium]
MSKEVRVRFAPSPTGPLHIGGVRTALFNYLFAKKNKGTFILRIEDTDQTRFIEGAEEYINESLEWLGIIPDEGVKQGGEYGPYRQSERMNIYRQYADKLIEKGWAYYAFDTPEELDALRNKYEAEKKTFSYDAVSRTELNNSLKIGDTETKNRINSGVPYVVRFKMPGDEIIQGSDLVRGDVKFNTSTLDDKVIFKSDGLPTYHLANVVDDYLMKISHVIRGEEWLPSLPLHIMLYRALGWDSKMPWFAHLPLILKPSGKGKLSKRDGDKEGFPVFPLEWKSTAGEISSGYREEGYFPETVVNLLALLGWNPGTEQEIFTIDELTRQFSLEKVNKAGARFDPAKAKWFNQQYLQKKPDKVLAEQFSILLRAKGVEKEMVFLERVVKLVKERSVFISDFWDQSSFFFEAPVSYDEKTKKKFWKEDSSTLVKECLKIIKEAEPFSSLKIEDKIKTYIESNELGFGKVMNPLRLALVGAGKGPHLFDIMEMIGKKETVERIEKALKIL